MTDLTATPTTLTAVLKTAVAGDVLSLAPGVYGAFGLVSKTFNPPLRVVAADPANPPVFNTIRLVSVMGVEFDGMSVDFKPTATTYGHQNIVAFEGAPARAATATTPAVPAAPCKAIAFRNSKVRAGVAINGVTDTVLSTPYGTVQGQPLGRAIFVSAGSEVEITGCDLTGTERGIVLDRAGRVVITDNDIHDLRKTPIVGQADHTVVERNNLYGMRPWKWGQTPQGDHADYIALYAAANHPAPKFARIAHNRTWAAGGTEILGINVAGFEAVEIEDNVVSGSDHQGIAITGPTKALVKGNVLPGRGLILVRLGSNGSVVQDNISAGPVGFMPTGMTVDQLAALKASVTLSNNLALQYADSAKPGYLSPAKLAEIVSSIPAATPTATFQAVRSAAYPNLAPPPPPPDPRDAEIAELTAKLEAANASLAAANESTAEALRAGDEARATVKSLIAAVDEAAAVNVALKGTLAKINEMTAP